MSASSDAGKEQHKRLTDEITRLKNEKTSEQERYQAQTNRLSSEVTSLKNSITQLDTEKEEAEQRGTSQNAELKDARNRLTDYQARQSELEAQVGELQAGALPDPILMVPENCTVLGGEPYAKVAEFVRQHYDEEAQRFTLKVNTSQIFSVRMSEQLSYMLGFATDTFSEDRTAAKYMPDLHGGVHSLYVHAPRLIEPTIIGDTWAPILRIAKVKGGPGDYVEDVFLTPQYHKVLEKQVSEISIQVRTSTGRLVPFNWGNCTIVLHFKKLSLF